jgi:hypothetical protein
MNLGAGEAASLPPGFVPGAPGAASVEEAEAQQQKAAQVEEMRQSMLTQILTPEAKERLSRIGEFGVVALRV